jgi:hypothetical protein
VLIYARIVAAVVLVGTAFASCSDGRNPSKAGVNVVDATGVNEAILERHIAGCRGNAAHANRIIRDAKSQDAALAEVEALPTYPESLIQPEDRRLANYICAALAAGELTAREEMREALRRLR